MGRVLARDVVAAVDVPGFDRSNLDGYAVASCDTYQASEERPRQLRLLDDVLATGVLPQCEVHPGEAVAIATGGMVPRGADAVVMVEHADVDGQNLIVRKPVSPGHGVTFAGTDIAAGETVLRRGQVLTSRETGVLAAIGAHQVCVVRRPRVAIFSTGDELLPPGKPMRPGLVYDSNARILADAVRELSGEPLEYGIIRDDLAELRGRLGAALATAEMVLLSGGTSKGAGDLAYRAVAELGDPGIVAHGVALKPGKPICLAVTAGKPVVVLPGFPTSAIFTFHEFVAPVIRKLAGLPPESRQTRQARLAVKVNSEIGRTEYVLVGLVEADGQLVAYPLGKGSGSVTTFSGADGFITIGRQDELVPSGSLATVQLLARDLRLADLVVIGSHCVGLDYLLGQLQERGFATKFLAVGSTAGLHAAQRGECDVAGMHLLDAQTGVYNRPFVTPGLRLQTGYYRMQGVVYRHDDSRFADHDARSAIEAVKHNPRVAMVNRNQGSGTRVLIDRLLDGIRPPGYAVQARSHNAVAAAVSQGRADWGLAIEHVARLYGLGFLPLLEESYDLVIPSTRWDRPAVLALRELLADPAHQAALAALGCMIASGQAND